MRSLTGTPSAGAADSASEGRVRVLLPGLGEWFVCAGIVGYGSPVTGGPVYRAVAPLAAALRRVRGMRRCRVGGVWLRSAGWSQTKLRELMGWQSSSTACAAEGRSDGLQRALTAEETERLSSILGISPAQLTTRRRARRSPLARERDFGRVLDGSSILSAEFSRC